LNKLVISFFGSPSSGKTVAATSLFAALKKQHLAVVLVAEFAKEKVVEGNTTALSNQIFIWASQQYNIYSAYRHADLVVTDSPILLGTIYNNDNDDLHKVICREHGRYNNINIMMELDPLHPYSMVGRIHDLEESIEIQNSIFGMLHSNNIPYLLYNSTTEDEIVQLIIENMNDDSNTV
jgi:hypothetical protein